MMTRENLKHVMISILIGAGIAFVSSLLEGLLNLIKNIGHNLPGITAGMVWYLKSWKTNRIV